MASPRPQSFAALLRRHRLAAGLTQEQLAAKAGVSPEAIGVLERGLRRAPHRDTLALLADALGLAPDDRARLEASVSRPRTSATADIPPPAAPAPRPPGNLPAPLTPLIGREHEEAAAVHLLRREDVRLLTLTGAPGIGKTRLALQVADDLQDDAPDGVFMVELAPITDPALVLPTVIRTLGIHETGAAPDAELAALTAWLRTRCVLLLLDNCEQVAAGALQVVALLWACSGLRVLVTSRVPLRVRGEHRLAVPPLALPDLAALPPAAELGQYAAVALFIDRARAVKPTFALTAAQAPAVAAICYRLDGLPLAIELAAAWVRLLTPAALLARLERRLPLLMAGAHDLPERQQTLRGAIAWSHDLLTPAEQTLLRRLAIFVGGGTLEAAEAVCGEVGRIEAVLPALAALVDASLVDQHEEAGGGEIRFRLLELVREDALERLATSGEAEAMRERHARYYSRLAQQAGIGLAGPEMESWIARLASEDDNLRASFEWAKKRDSTAGLRMAVDLGEFWGQSGRVSEGRKLLEELLDLDRRAGMQATSLLRASALNAAGIMAFRQTDYAHATVRHDEALSLARRIGHKRVTAHAQSMLGNIAWARRDFTSARAHFGEVLALRQQMQNELDTATAAYMAGQLTGPQGEALWQEQGFIATFCELGGTEMALGRLAYSNKRNIAGTLGRLGKLAMLEGDYHRAVEVFEQVRDVFAELGRTVDASQAQIELGEAALLQGNYERAQTLLEPVLPILRNIGIKESVAEVLSYLGRIAVCQGDPTRATALFRESILLCRELGAQEGIAENLEGLGIAMRAVGQRELAVRLLGKAATIRAYIAKPLSPADRETVGRVTADLRAALGEERLTAIWEMSGATPLEQLLATDER